MLVYFVRHGESQGNISKSHQGPDTPLTDNGFSQAKALAKRFDKISVERIISSPHLRAVQTAEIIGEKLQIKPELNQQVSEWKAPDEIIGMSFHDQKAKEILDKIKSHSEPDWYFSNEENLHDIKKRTLEFLNYLTTQKNESILVVSHSFFTKMMIVTMLFGENLTDRELLAWNDFVISHNTNITLCEYKEDQSRWRLVTWKDHSHLG